MNYSVYIHTSPSGKVYIGITRRLPKYRWGKGGKGYKENEYFYRAILKYGWDNFSHEILCDNLTKEEAQKLEIELIALYNAADSNFGYNISLGGEAGFYNKDSYSEDYYKQYREEHRDKIIAYLKQYYKDNKEKAAAVNKEYHRTHAEEIKKKKHEYYLKHREEIIEKKRLYRKSKKRNEAV